MNSTNPVPEKPDVEPHPMVVDPVVPGSACQTSPQALAGRHFGVLDTGHPLTGVGPALAFPQAMGTNDARISDLLRHTGRPHRRCAG
jgi:hypothetical protein